MIQKIFYTMDKVDIKIYTIGEKILNIQNN